MSESIYVLDTSALVGAWVRHYPRDVMPGLWERLDELGQVGRLVVPEEVFIELQEKDDDLYAWTKARYDSLVEPTDAATMMGARTVLLDHPGLTKTGTGRGKADPFVIAAAERGDRVVVTEEQGGSATKPRIPFVCHKRAVAVCSMLELLRREGWSFT